MSLKGKIKSCPFCSQGGKKRLNVRKAKRKEDFRLQMREGVVEPRRRSVLSTDETTDKNLGALTSVAAEREWSCSAGRNNTNYTNV